MWSCLAMLLLMLCSGCAVDVTMKKEFGKTGLTQEEKNTLLHMHNSYRSAVKPTASNMLEMAWDDNIARKAQDWANKCIGGHRPSEQYGPNEKWGESIYTKWGPTFHEARGVETWFREYYNYTYSTHKCDVANCNHYLAISWATTSAMGCGIRHCDEMPQKPEWGKAYFLVCNYEKRVISNTQPYIAGPPCSKCPEDHPKCRYNLCVTQKMYDENIGYNGSTTLTGLERGAASSVSAPSVVLIFLPVYLVAQLIPA